MPYTWTATLWSDDIAQEDHVLLGLARLIWKYRGDQPRIQDFLRALLEETQSIEDAAWQVLTEIWPWTAVGAQLDVLGKIVVQMRSGLTDDQYRLFILGRIRVNRSNGHIWDITDLFDIFGVTGAHIDEGRPAEIEISVVDEMYGDLMGELVGDATAGGVLLQWIWSSHDEENTFAMGNALGADETNITGGFGDLTGATQTTGGYLSGGFQR
jgi:hypothetical protein